MDERGCFMASSGASDLHFRWPLTAGRLEFAGAWAGSGQ